MLAQIRSIVIVHSCHYPRREEYAAITTSFSSLSTPTLIARSHRPLSSPTFHFLSPYLSSLALMASFARTVPAIYVPGALPPPLPLLASQTDLFTNSIHPVRVFHEELIPTQRTKIPKSLRFNPYVSGLNAVSNTKILLYRIDQRLSQK